MMADGRTGGRAVGRIIAIATVLSVGPTVRLPAQVSFHFAAGVRYSSTLVHDSIAGPIDLRPALAPTLLLTVQEALSPGWSADATLDVSPSGLRRHETGGSFDAGSFTAFAFTVGLRRHVAPGLSARIAAGGLTYSAAARGVFREGSGGLFPLGSVAATYTPSFGARRRLELEARYDVHGFITPALRTEGFRDSRLVHRVALLARVGWGGRGEPTP
ncbi:MAG TPA: hypothetical protein VGQ06_00915 [Gemmatimonadales bacterium]|jgi:hypothetical protein|nr:hypothetical protein [Gemmatimonadales bacterium]